MLKIKQDPKLTNLKDHLKYVLSLKKMKIDATIRWFIGDVTITQG
jgi:hypothetical protein